MGSPEPSPLSSAACVSTQLLSAQCGDKPHCLSTQGNSNAHAGGLCWCGHAKLPLKLAAARVMSQGCSQDSSGMHNSR